MIWNLELAWLLMAIAAVAVIGFFFGSALHAIMRDDGFGPTGNTILFTAGFFLAVLIANMYGINLRELSRATAYGLSGAFVVIALLALCKAALARL